MSPLLSNPMSVSFTPYQSSAALDMAFLRALALTVRPRPWLVPGCPSAHPGPWVFLAAPSIPPALMSPAGCGSQTSLSCSEFSFNVRLTSSSLFGLPSWIACS